MMNSSSFESRVKGCLLGGACGDALGYPVEHKSLSDIYDAYGEEGLCEMQLENGIARITDDTQMTIYTAQGLIHAADKNNDYAGFVSEVHLSYLRWISSLLKNENEIVSMYSHLYSSQALLENDLLNEANSGLDVKMCRGGSTFDALLSGERYSIDYPPEEGCRCGTIMRCAPIGVYCHDKPECAFRLGRDCGVLTHGCPSAYLASGFMCMLLSYLLCGKDLEWSIDQCMEYLFTQKDSTSLYNKLEKGIRLAKEPSPKAIDDIRSIGKGWRADENLAISLYCVLRYKRNVKAALIAAVNHSGDSDSVGAVCGNIIGAYAGYEAIPEEYLDHLQFKELLEEQGKKLIAHKCLLEYFVFMNTLV